MVDGVAAAALPGRRSRFLVALQWLDRNVERSLMLPLYAFIALLIGGEGILRYATSTQTQWGGAAAIHAFIFLSWLGCAYHVRHRSHLRFDAVRQTLPRRLRAAACIVDDLIWLLLAAIVVLHSSGMVAMQAEFGSMLEGTESVPLWLATATVPASWVLIAVRAVQDIVIVCRNGGGG